MVRMTMWWATHCGGRGNVVLGSPHPISQGRKLQEGGGPRKGGIRVGWKSAHFKLPSLATGIKNNPCPVYVPYVMFASHTVWVTEGHTAIAHIQNGWNLLWSHVHITQAFPSRPRLWWCVQNQEMQFFWLLNLCLSRSVLCWRCIDTLFKSYKATANI